MAALSVGRAPEEAVAPCKGQAVIIHSCCTFEDLTRGFSCRIAAPIHSRQVPQSIGTTTTITIATQGEGVRSSLFYH